MLDINKQAMKYSLQGQTVTFTKETMRAIFFMRDIPTQRVTSFLILMMREIRYPKFLKRKQAFQSRSISKLTYHLAAEKHRVKNTALIPLILMLFY